MSKKSKDPLENLPLSPLRFKRCGECGHKSPGHSTACSRRETLTNGQPVQQEEAPTFSLAQIATLKTEYAKYPTAPVSILGKLHAYFDKLPDATLKQLALADIKYVSAIARNDCKTRGIDLGFTQAEKDSAKKCYLGCDTDEKWYRVFGSYFDNLNKSVTHFHQVCRASDYDTAFALCNPNYLRFTILTAEAVSTQPVAPEECQAINDRAARIASDVLASAGRLD